MTQTHTGSAPADFTAAWREARIARLTHVMLRIIARHVGRNARADRVVEDIERELVALNTAANDDDGGPDEG